MSAKDDVGTKARLNVALGAALRDLTPTRLSDIIGRQEQASLYLTTETQLADLAGPVTSLNVKGEFTDWRFVTIQIHTPEWRDRKAYLLGLRAGRIITMTSSIRRVDFTEGLVQTKSSVYRLRKDARGLGEPSEVRIPTIVTDCTDDRDRWVSADAWCSNSTPVGHDDRAQGCP